MDLSAFQRRENLPILIPEDGIAIELGVARGNFSKAILSGNPNFRRLYSVDRWGGERGHNDKEYKIARGVLDVFGDRSIVIRDSFENAISSFENGLFDFIYIDGYAHTGQDSGKTIRDWWQKLKPGGIYAGHDYCAEWPDTTRAVDEFAKVEGLEVFSTNEKVNRQTVTYPSWIIRKPEK